MHIQFPNILGSWSNFSICVTTLIQAGDHQGPRDASDEHQAPLPAQGQDLPPPLGRDAVVSDWLPAGGSSGGE